jgi:hypothetical protein
MNTVEITSVAIRLIIGAAASFLAILVWAKTRDAAWMLIVIGTVANYVSIVYTTLTLFGVTLDLWLTANMGLIAGAVIASLPTLFFILAFAVMVGRKYGIK